MASELEEVQATRSPDPCEEECPIAFGEACQLHGATLLLLCAVSNLLSDARDHMTQKTVGREEREREGEEGRGLSLPSSGMGNASGQNWWDQAVHDSTVHKSGIHIEKPPTTGIPPARVDTQQITQARGWHEHASHQVPHSLFPDEPSKSKIRSSFPGLHPKAPSRCCQSIRHPSDQGVFHSIPHSSSRRRRRRSVSSCHGRIGRNGLYVLCSFLSESPERLERYCLHVCSIRWWISRILLFGSSLRGRFWPVLHFRLVSICLWTSHSDIEQPPWRSRLQAASHSSPAMPLGISTLLARTTIYIAQAQRSRAPHRLPVSPLLVFQLPAVVFVSVTLPSEDPTGHSHGWCTHAANQWQTCTGVEISPRTAAHHLLRPVNHPDLPICTDLHSLVLLSFTCRSCDCVVDNVSVRSSTHLDVNLSPMPSSGPSSPACVCRSSFRQDVEVC